jgi:hypothetical protein
MRRQPQELNINNMKIFLTWPELPNCNLAPQVHACSDAVSGAAAYCHCVMVCKTRHLILASYAALLQSSWA